jgi:oligoribonuclease NrnB/cAMP/cGMP phosphodiesterase (DHH superfamily)
MEFDLVIYHDECADGFTSAWIFKHYNPLIETKAVSYGSLKPNNIKNKKIAILDFSYNYEITMSIIQESSYLLILDHHESAKENLKNIKQSKKTKIIFDMNLSGAQLAWDYLYPNEIRPWFVDYVGDRDLWLKELPRTDEVSTALWFDGYFKDFQKLENLFYTSSNNDLENENHPIIIKGEQLLLCKELEITQFAEITNLATLITPNKNYTVRMISVSRQYTSDIGSLITNKYDDCDFAAIYSYNHINKKMNISLRANNDCIYNLSEITRTLPNGGGHPKAAAFSLNLDEFHKYFITNETDNKNDNKKYELENQLENIGYPSFSSYVNKEIENYILTLKPAKLVLENNYDIKMTMAPMHYHNLIIENIENETGIIILYYYYFGTRKWYLTIKSFGNENLKDIFKNNNLDYKFEIFDSDDKEHIVVKWKIDESYYENISDYFE